MLDYVKISLLLCAFGFFRELRPNEPFAVEFLSGEWRNVTSEQVNRQIYPMGTYSHLAQLILIFLITDFLRYKPIIVLSAVVGIVMWVLLLWTSSLEWLMVVQFFYGTFMAAEVAYYTYMYAKVDKDQYQRVTSHTRAAISSGKLLSGIVGQLLVSYELVDLRQLNYISLGTQVISLIFAFALPRVKVSLYFHAKATPTEDPRPNTLTIENERPNAINLLRNHFVTAYSNREVLYWSIWWALATAGFIQAQSYAQVLWQEMNPDKENFYNGGVEAVHTFLATIVAIVAGLINMRFFERHHLWVITGCSLLQGGLILYEGLTQQIFVAYLMYVLFGATYMFMITLVSASVAKQLLDDSFALIFGINTFLALMFQTILTVIVVSDGGFALTPKYQYVVNGVYFFALAILYLGFAIMEKLVQRIRRS